MCHIYFSAYIWTRGALCFRAHARSFKLKSLARSSSVRDLPHLSQSTVFFVAFAFYCVWIVFGNVLHFRNVGNVGHLGNMIFLIELWSSKAGTSWAVVVQGAAPTTTTAAAKVAPAAEATNTAAGAATIIMATTAVVGTCEMEEEAGMKLAFQLLTKTAGFANAA